MESATPEMGGNTTSEENTGHWEQKAVGDFRTNSNMATASHYLNLWLFNTFVETLKGMQYALS